MLHASHLLAHAFTNRVFFFYWSLLIIFVQSKMARRRQKRAARNLKYRKLIRNVIKGEQKHTFDTFDSPDIIFYRIAFWNSISLLHIRHSLVSFSICQHLRSIEWEELCSCLCWRTCVRENSEWKPVLNVAFGVAIASLMIVVCRNFSCSLLSLFAIFVLLPNAHSRSSHLSPMRRFSRLNFQAFSMFAIFGAK